MAMASAGTGLLALAAIGVERSQPLESCSSSLSGLASTLATGYRSPGAAAWVLARRMRSGACSSIFRRKGGGPALAAVARPGGHRLPGDRAHPSCVRHRDQDEEVRRSPSRPGAGTGGVAVAPASAVVSARRRAGGLPRSPAWRRAGRARRPRDLGRSADPRAAKVRLQPAHCGHAQTQTLRSARRLSRVHRGRPADGASGGVPFVPRIAGRTSGNAKVLVALRKQVPAGQASPCWPAWEIRADASAFAW